MYDLFGDQDNISDKFPGFYRGVVVDNKDPSKSARIKVRVYPMFKGVSDGALPWAIMADPSMGGFANVGGIKVPEVGAHVFVFFEGGDHRYPVFFAGAPAIENDSPDVPTLSREAESTVDDVNAKRKTGVSTANGGSWDEPQSYYAAQYPSNKVFRTKKGIVVEMDDTDGNVRFHVYHPSGTREEVNNAGDKVEHVTGDHFEIILGDNNVYVKGMMNITVDGNTNVYSKGTITAKTDADLVCEVGGSATVNVGGSTDITSGGAATIKAPKISLNP